MKAGKISSVITALLLCSLFSMAAFASVSDDQVTSQKIREADGTSGQDTNSGSGVKTEHIQDGAVTDAKIAGSISSNKIQKAANTLIVAKSGGGFTSIQSAINSISPSADNPYLIKVMPGTYVENITMKSYIHLQGAGPDITTIQSPSQNVVVITVDNTSNVIISGFTLRDGIIGIHAWQSSSLRVIGNKMIANRHGMTFDYTSDNRSAIKDNTFADNQETGLAISTASFLVVSGNSISGNGSHGVTIQSSSPAVSHNAIIENVGVGIYVGGSDATIAENIVSGNGSDGVYIWAASPLVIHNRITGNGSSSGADLSVAYLGSANISFNVYDSIVGGGRGFGQYNVKSDGSLAPAP